MRTKEERLQQILETRGVQSRAESSKGLLRAAKKSTSRAVRVVPCPDGSSTSRPQPVRVHDALELLEPWTGQGRVRTVDPHRPLYRAVSAALGRDVEDTASTVANSYRGEAYESIVAATRFGGVVAVYLLRRSMGRSPSGKKTTVVRADLTDTLYRRRDILALLPRLPSGWRIGVDRDGVWVGAAKPSWLGPADRYHLTIHDLLRVIEGQCWRFVVFAKTQRDEFARSVRLDERRRAKLRLVAHLEVTIQDSIQVGHCEQGTLSFAQQHGIDITKPVTVGQLLATGDPRAVLVCLQAWRRARGERKAKVAA
jgi:hypothetical protein